MRKITYYLGNEPDGRELFRYRIPNARYTELRDDLSAELPRGLSSPSPDVCALFCVFAAEWWRREHVQGPWSWDGIKAAVGVSSAPYTQLASTVDHGLQVLKRRLLRSTDGDRARLVTVACEGGLPLRRLQVENAKLAIYFRDVLENLQALGMRGTEEPEKLAILAAQSDHRLPLSLRRDIVHRLAGELVGRAWSLRQAVPEDAADPIEALDHAIPDWRDRLPLVVDDEAATTLLRGLLRDVARVASGRGHHLRVVTRLLLQATSARLVRVLEGPSTVDDEALAMNFGGQSMPSGNRLQLRLRSEEGGSVRAGALARAGTQGWSFQPSDGAELAGDAAEGLVGLIAASRRGGSVEAALLGGGARLGPLPWVFRLAGDRPDVWQLVAAGSCRRRDPVLVVALPHGAEADGAVVDLGQSVRGRRLVRVTGEARVRTDDGLVRIVASHGRNDADLFELRGRRLSGISTSRTAWLGLPSLVRLVGGREEAVPFEVLTDGHWRTDSAALGDLGIRVMRDGEVLYRERIRVVPEDLRVQLDVSDGRRPGRIIVESTRLVRAGVPTDGRWEAISLQSEGRAEIALTATAQVPGQVQINLLFQGGALEGVLPFPVRGLRFEAPDESTISHGTELHIKRLGGIRAVALSPNPRARFAVSLKPVGTGNGPAPAERTVFLETEPSGEHALDLRDVQSGAVEIIDGTEGIDAGVRIDLWEVGGAGRPVSITARRYDWVLDRDEATGDVVLRGPSMEELQDVVVEARQFVDVDAVIQLPRLHSARYSQPRWAFDPASKAGTTWLVTAREAGWYRCRPVPFWGKGASPSLQGLRAAVELDEQAKRLDAIRSNLDSLCSSWSHADWAVVDGYLRLLGDLPASTFDLVRTIAHHPCAAAMVALRVGGWAPADALQVFDGLEELVFLWEAIPLEAWDNALDHLNAAFPASALELAAGEIAARGALVAQVIPSFHVVLDRWSRSRGMQIEQPATPGIPLAMTRANRFAPMLLRPRRDARAEVIRKHAADEQWPVPHPSLELVVPSDLAVSEPTDDLYRRRVLDAPVLLALAAAGQRVLDPVETLFLEDVRSFDEPYFSECFLRTFCALVARDAGA